MTARASAAGASSRRAIAWALIGAGAIAAYFLLVEPALDLGAGMRARADALSQTLASARRGAVAARVDAQAISVGRGRYGEVAMPGDPRQRPIDFNQRIAEVLREAGIMSHESRSRPGAIARGPLQETLAEGARIEALVTELEFEATPEQASRVVAALELCPEVAAISRLHLDRAPGGERRLAVSLALETWVLSQGGRR